MYTASSDVHPYRFLTANALAVALQRFRLPRYSGLAEALGDYEIYGRAAALWRGMWPDTLLPQGDAWGVEIDLLNRIAAECFPLSEMVDETIFSAGEHALYGYVDHASWGIGWESGGFAELSPEYKPLAALVASGLQPAAGWEDAQMTFLDDAQAWLEERGGQPLDEDAALFYGDIRRTLAEMLPPLDGLAVAYDCLLRNTGNPFLDLVDCGWRGEYDTWDQMADYGWTAEDVRALAALYDQALPRITRLEAYLEWWSSDTAGRTAEVLEALAAAFDLNDGTEPGTGLLIDILCPDGGYDDAGSWDL